MNSPAILAALCLAWSALDLQAAESDSSVSRARVSITVDELQQHAETLAGDVLEGREAGQPGGQAAASYVRQVLKTTGVPPAGDNGSYFQSFGPGYRNVLALIPGTVACLLYTSPSPRDKRQSRMPSSA